MKNLLTALIITIASQSFAQDTAFTLPKYVHKLGLHAGTTSGLGLSYKLLYKNKFMVQAVTLPVASANYKYINSGLSFKYKFKDFETLDFYVFGAGSYTLIQDTYDYYTGIPPYGTEIRSSITDNFNFSGGIAFEIGEGELLKWGIQMGYGIYSVGTTDWLTNLSIGTTIDFSLNSK